MSINVSVNDPDWDAKVMSEFFIQMMHKQLGEGKERNCINSVKVFRALKFNAIEDKVGYSRLITEHLAVKGYLEPCQKDEFQFTEQGLRYFRTMRRISWIKLPPPQLQLSEIVQSIIIIIFIIVFVMLDTLAPFLL